MSTGPACPDYAGHLREQHARLGQFVDLLERERVALNRVPVSIDALGEITDSKRSLAAALEHLEAARQRMAADNGHGRDLAGGAALAKQSDCADLWQALVARIELARERNQANGSAVHERLAFTRRSLAFLRRVSASTLYAANGRRHTDTGARIQDGA